MANNDSRSVGRPSNNPGRMEPRSVPVQHDKARINDQRKVRPHAAGTPAMGNRPSGGAQKPLKPPALNKEYMGMRDVPVKKITEVWPFSRRTQAALPHHGDALAWHNNGSGEISVLHIQNGQLVGQTKVSRQSLGQDMQDAKQQYFDAKKSRANLRWNPRKAGMAAIQQYASANGIDLKDPNMRIGEYGRDIPQVSGRAPAAAPAGPAAAQPATSPTGGGYGQQSQSYNINQTGRTSPLSSGGNVSSGHSFGNGGWGGNSSPGPGPTSPGPAGPGPAPSAKPRDISGGITMDEKINFLKQIDPDKYSDNTVQNMIKTGHTYQIDSAYNKARKSIRGGGVREGYPDTDYERDEPAHEARIGDLGWHGYPEEPGPPALNREFAQFRDLPVEKIHEMAEAEITNLVRRTAARLGFRDLVLDEEEEPLPAAVPTTQNAPIPRIRCRWFAEAEASHQTPKAAAGGHGLPKPTRPLPANIAGSGKNFRVKPGTNNARKQPGKLAGSGKAMKVKPGFIG